MQSQQLFVTPARAREQTRGRPVLHSTHLEVQMAPPIDRRKFLKVSGISLGVGALISVAPAMAGDGHAAAVRNWFRKKNGDAVTPFTFVQLSDAHVGFQGPPNPTGTRAFERAL